MHSEPNGKQYQWHWVDRSRAKHGINLVTKCNNNNIDRNPLSLCALSFSHFLSSFMTLSWIDDTLRRTLVCARLCVCLCVHFNHILKCVAQLCAPQKPSVSDGWRIILFHFTYSLPLRCTFPTKTTDQHEDATPTNERIYSITKDNKRMTKKKWRKIIINIIPKKMKFARTSDIANGNAASVHTLCLYSYFVRIVYVRIKSKSRKPKWRRRYTSDEWHLAAYLL